MHSDQFENKQPVGFVYHYDLVTGADEFGLGGMIVDQWDVRNLVPLAGINYMADVMFGDTTPIGTMYVGLFSNNYIPSAGALASDLPSTIGEFVGYSETTRPVWSRINTNGSISNEVTRAAFTCNASARLYGGFICSSNTKGGGGGLLLSVARFPSPRDVEAGMVLRVRAELALIATNVT